MTVLVNLSLINVLSQYVGGIILASNVVYSYHFIFNSILNYSFSYVFLSNHSHGGIGIGIHVYVVVYVKISTDVLYS